MTMPVIDDDALPGLRLAAKRGALAKAINDTLDRATSGAWRCTAASVARFRYRRGNRAILQLDLTLTAADGQQTELPGALWLYKGNKAKDVAARSGVDAPMSLPAMIFEPYTGGLLTLFPHDRRVPQIARFRASPDEFAQGLTGFAALSPPDLSRYRPGLGATFRWRTAGGTSFVKIFNDRPASERYADLARLSHGLQSDALSTPEPQGFDDAIHAVALKQAGGVPLADCLHASGSLASSIDTVLGGLDVLNSAEMYPPRTVGGDDLLKRARSVVTLLSAVDRSLAAMAGDALNALATVQPTLRQHPVHMDMKIEHVLLDGAKTCLLDMDSLALSDPLVDPAMLAARIELAGLERTVPQDISRAAIGLLRSAAGVGRQPVFDWLVCIARFQTARFVVQNMRPDWPDHVATLMRGVAALTPDPVFS